ncbi:albusnodin/ikarugamycin family macrolactam cyclase [Streptomyces sp. NPDC001339]|uniref:albusnodin/ikarugamycin family macrolactam cyclase n=1 Tax=Streptomyces sp. NPDC001339 TaxID=3364563 RepID=UPI0036A92F10
MRWFGGCAPGKRPVAPVGARLVWQDPPLWTVGDVVPGHLRTLEQSNAKLAVFGPCSATEQDMKRALSSPMFASAAGAWAGSYTAVRGGPGGAVEVLADATGASPVYTVATPDGEVWGSSAFALGALAGGAVDTDWLGAYLRERNAPASGLSAWVGVRSVPPGHVLRWSSDGGAPSLAEWWSPSERSTDAAMAALRWALGEGVRVRVEGVTATSDLAGMDSTTVTLLAARHGQVTGVTLHPVEITDGGDLEYAQSLCGEKVLCMRLPLTVGHLPFSESSVPLPVTDEPAPSTAVWAMFSEQLRAVAAVRSGCHLTGDGGDNLFTVPPTHLVNLSRQGRLLRMVGDAMDWARLRKQSPRLLIAAALRGDAGRIGRAERPRPAWLSANVPDPVGTGTTTDPNALLVASIRGVARSAKSELQLADSLGVALHNPYFDGAVLDAVVSACAEVRFSARRYKPLLADAFAGVLPKAHRERASKGVFVGDFHQGLRINLRRLLTLADGRLAARGLVSPGPLRAAMHAAALGARTIWPPLLSAIAAESWLEAIDRSPRTEWCTLPWAGAQ